MRGITAHAGAVRLAQLRIAERMAEKMGDSVFAGQCRKWLESGRTTLEEKLWDGENYLLSLDPSSGKKNDLVLAFQLDGEWIAHLHGLHGVFPSDRVDTTLSTIKRLNSWVPLNGVIDVIQHDGRPTTLLPVHVLWAFPAALRGQDLRGPAAWTAYSRQPAE